MNEEQIRKEIAQRCVDNCDDVIQEQCNELIQQYGGANACSYCVADRVLNYLRSQGLLQEKSLQFSCNRCGYISENLAPVPDEGFYSEYHYYKTICPVCTQPTNFWRLRPFETDLNVTITGE